MWREWTIEATERRVKSVGPTGPRVERPSGPPGAHRWRWCPECATFHQAGASVAEMERDWSEVAESRAWLGYLQVDGRFLVVLDWLRDWRPSVTVTNQHIAV